jgi:hypothetical protein
MFNAKSTSARRMDSALRRNAEIVTVYPGIRCPCSLDPNRADPTHDACRGTGHLHLMDRKFVVRAVVTSFNPRMNLMEAGLAMPGDIVLMPLVRPTSEKMIGPYDMVRMTNWEGGESFPGESVVVNELPTSLLSYHCVRVNLAYSLSGTVITPYEEGSDFTVEGHVVTWNAKPEPGTIVSFRYHIIPEYIVMGLPTQRWQRGSSLGDRLIARRRHMVLPGGSTFQIE